MSNEVAMEAKDLNWKTENGSEEESKCLEPGSGEADGNQRLRAMLGRFKGNTVLSPAVKVALIVLGILCLFFFITIIILAVFWPRIPNAALRCTSPDCLTLSSMYLRRMDGQADPCTDQRRWACGKWLRDNARALPARPSWSMVDEIRSRDLRRLRDRITTLLPSSGVDSLEWKIKTLYDSCVALEHVEADDKRPLMARIAELGGWRVTRNWSRRSWSWREVLVKLQSKYGASPLFSVSLDLVPGTNETCFHLKPAGLGLPDPSFYIGGSESKPVKAYKAFMKDAALCLDATSADALYFADDVFSFERRLAMGMGEDMYRQRIYTLKELNEAEQFMEFNNLFRAMFPEVQFSLDTKVLVTAPGYITQLSAITTATEISILNAYFIWTLIRVHLPFMSQKFQLIWREFQSQITGGTEDFPRWEFCTNFVLESMPLASLAYLEDDDEINLNKDSTIVESVEKIFEGVCSAAVEQITSSSNLDETFKNVLLKEVDGLSLQIGMKPHVKNPEFLNQYYKQLNVQKDNLFVNVYNVLDFKRKLLQQSYLDRDTNIVRETSQHLIEVKATYSSHLRAVLLPTSFLVPPYHHVSYPRSVQYARIGVNIGEAIAKGIDTTDQVTGISLRKFEANTIYCLNGLLSNTTRWMGTRDEADVVAETAYTELVGATLAALANRNAEDKFPLLPELERYSGSGLFGLALAETKCSIRVPEQVGIDGIHLKMDGETFLNIVWPQIPGIRESLKCGEDARCPGPL